MFLLMGSHLFDPELLMPYKAHPIVMLEDFGLCTHFRYHRQKLVFFLEAMRNHRDLLRSFGFTVIYGELELSETQLPFTEKLAQIIKREKASTLTSFAIEDKFFRQELHDLCQRLNLQWRVIKSPLFLNDEQEIHQAISNDSRPFMKNFYERERTRKHILMTQAGSPVGGKFSFDDENRLRLPKNIQIPVLSDFTPSVHREEVIRIIEKHFHRHPGALSPWLPATRKQAQQALMTFLDERLHNFGTYEDAIDERSPFLFHSVLSPLLNCGLLTPQEVIGEALKLIDRVPINSLEGFIRQIIGWREFVRGIYEKFSTREEESNFFKHHRRLTSAWYHGTTGIYPLDTAIKKAWDYGYCHHIERLMIISNIMLLSEICPREVHRWFMEMFVDSADWVMGPNVFGMGQFCDGGLFTTKPYICGSNYILKMSSYKKADWCDVVDGLYWRFIDKHRNFFNGQPRLSMMPKMLDRIDTSRKKYLFLRANEFIEAVTMT